MNERHVRMDISNKGTWKVAASLSVVLCELGVGVTVGLPPIVHVAKIL
jgi:hypothetical protein